MKLSIAKYLILILLSSACTNQEREYGYVEKGKDNLKVSLQITRFKKYGELVDRIRQITCNDSIPRIIIENNNTVRNIYPSVNCEPIKFDPKGKHYVTLAQGKAYHNHCSREINVDSLNGKLLNHFSYFRTSNLTDEPNSYLVIIESERNEKINGIENLLNELTSEFDNLKTNSNLIIAFWEVVPHIPPLPETVNELQQNE